MDGKTFNAILVYCDSINRRSFPMCTGDQADAGRCAGQKSQPDSRSFTIMLLMHNNMLEP